MKTTEGIKKLGAPVNVAIYNLGGGDMKHFSEPFLNIPLQAFQTHWETQVYLSDPLFLPLSYPSLCPFILSLIFVNPTNPTVKAPSSSPKLSSLSFSTPQVNQPQPIPLQ